MKALFEELKKENLPLSEKDATTLLMQAIEDPDFYIEYRDENLDTLLFLAVKNNHFYYVKKLLLAGAAPFLTKDETIYFKNIARTKILREWLSMYEENPARWVEKNASRDEILESINFHHGQKTLGYIKEFGRILQRLIEVNDTESLEKILDLNASKDEEILSEQDFKQAFSQTADKLLNFDQLALMNNPDGQVSFWSTMLVAVGLAIIAPFVMAAPMILAVTIPITAFTIGPFFGTIAEEITNNLRKKNYSTYLKIHENIAQTKASKAMMAMIMHASKLGNNILPKNSQFKPSNYRFLQEVLAIENNPKEFSVILLQELMKLTPHAIDYKSFVSHFNSFFKDQPGILSSFAKICDEYKLGEVYGVTPSNNTVYGDAAAYKIANIKAQIGIKNAVIIANLQHAPHVLDDGVIKEVGIMAKDLKAMQSKADTMTDITKELIKENQAKMHIEK